MKYLVVILGVVICCFILYIEFYWGNPSVRSFPNNGFDEIRPILNFIRCSVYPVIIFIFFILLFSYIYFISR